MQNHKRQLEIIGHFALDGTVVAIRDYGSGHINETYLVKIDHNGAKAQYILQQVNTDVFQNIDQLMENVMGVTTYLKARIEEAGGNPERETLQLILTRDGKSYYQDEDGRCYRMSYFIKGAVSYDEVERPEDFYESALAFGNFQYMLSDYPAETLHETIPDFHHTGKRFTAFCQAVKDDIWGRAAYVQEEIAFVMARAAEMTALTDLLENGELPLRVTHNDTKLNNVMIDTNTGKGICVIDLDTVMPGSSLYDFGDAIRFGANTAAEDEKDLSKVTLDLNLYEWYVKGYLEGCKGSLTEWELQLLPLGAKMMTLECGMRFLTDHLQGDTYFKIHRENHNLDRCRTQFALVKDMEEKWNEMKAVIKKYC